MGFGSAGGTDGGLIGDNPATRSVLLGAPAAVSAVAAADAIGPLGKATHTPLDSNSSNF